MMLLVSIPNEAHVAAPESPNHRFQPTGLASAGDTLRQRHGLGRSNLQTSYVRPLFRTPLT
jgi:hypothetical protein